MSQEAPDHAAVVVVQHARFVSIKLAAALLGRTEKAIRRRIESGTWLEGREYRRDPRGGINIDMRGVEKWVDRGK